MIPYVCASRGNEDSDEVKLANEKEDAHASEETETASTASQSEGVEKTLSFSAISPIVRVSKEEEEEEEEEEVDAEAGFSPHMGVLTTSGRSTEESSKTPKEEENEKVEDGAEKEKADGAEEKVDGAEKEKADGEDEDALSSGDGIANDVKSEDENGEKMIEDAKNKTTGTAAKKKRRLRKKKGEKSPGANNESDEDAKGDGEKEKKSERSTKKKKSEEQAKEGKAGKKGKGKGKGKGKNSRLETGTCKWFHAQKGFGFISSDWNGEEVFAHNTEISSDGFRTLYEGEKVQFTTIVEDKRKKATNITRLNGGPVRANTPGPYGGKSQYAYPGPYGPPKGSPLGKGGIKKNRGGWILRNGGSTTGCWQRYSWRRTDHCGTTLWHGIYELSRRLAQNGPPYPRHPQYPIPNVPNPHLDQMMVQWLVQIQAQAARAGLGNPWFPPGPHRW